MDQGNTTSRPSVLTDVTASQMEELEEHYNAGDRAAWDRVLASYGWSQQDADAVWQWFGENPEGSGSTRSEGWGSGPTPPGSGS